MLGGSDEKIEFTYSLGSDTFKDILNEIRDPNQKSGWKIYTSDVCIVS
jgi:hypothetical protein